MNPQFKKGVLELCVLSQLVNQDKYGYELTEHISREVEITTGTLYLILKRLKDDEYVETYLVESEEGPARKYYRLTAKGQKYQSQLKTEWLDFTKRVGRLIGGEQNHD